ncbi:terminal nucleotidyltransferase 5C [Hydra vulgaris]|uniref:polynucleotide adenylyltransferase n=1 Tax=Hydra vulgaris TaxID=6087 RepID=A0ABM4BII2_HYDVU
MDSNKMYILDYEEVCRLEEVLGSVIQVHGRGNFPTLEVKPKDFIKQLTAKLLLQELSITDYRLNGSTASYVLNGQNEDHDNYTYNDLDLIFNINLKSSSDFMKVKDSVLETLMDFLPAEVSKERMSGCTMNEAYVRKMVKITNKQDNWSLISLTNDQGRNIELKFVDSMKRKFEFSVDSFQILLDSLIKFQDLQKDIKMSPTLYPSVKAESVYGDFEEARYHLRNKLIATKNPEEIRGGGLMKYCSLLCRDFKPVSEEIRNMEKYMCSRFFIDFKDVPSQQQKLERYLQSHDLENNNKRYKYLTILHNVIEKSTVCLMGHERRQTLCMITNLTNQVYQPSNYQHITVFYSVPPYMHSYTDNYRQTYYPTQHYAIPNNRNNEYVLIGSWNTPEAASYSC